MSDPVIYLSSLLSVVRTGRGYEIRVNAGTHSLCVGTSASADKALRTAERLERYPANVLAFANVYPLLPLPDERPPRSLSEASFGWGAWAGKVNAP